MSRDGIAVLQNADAERALRLREGVRAAYSAAAEKPEAQHPFPVGMDFAASVGYRRELLARLPAACVAAFSGVSNVAVSADIPVGARVLDLGCGAGLDSLMAAQRAGPAGRVLGLDFSGAMLTRAREAKALCQLESLAFLQGDAEKVPIKDGLIDVALVNGIFNLNPARDAIFRELSRVARKGGVVYAAELILREPLPPEARDSDANWFA